MGVPYNLFYVVFSFWIVHELLFCNTPNRPILDFSRYLLAQRPANTKINTGTGNHSQACQFLLLIYHQINVGHITVRGRKEERRAEDKLWGTKDASG